MQPTVPPSTSNGIKRSTLNSANLTEIQTNSTATAGSSSNVSLNDLPQDGQILNSNEYENQSDSPTPEKRSYIVLDPALKLDTIASAVSKINNILYLLY